MSPRTLKVMPVKSTLVAALLAATAITAVPSRSYAQEDQAQSMYDDAMDNDYLNTKFDDAVAKLNKAVKQCGKKCSKTLVGKLHVALAVVYGAGKGDNKAAKAELEKAFKADKNAKPLDLYFTDDLKKLFEAAKKNAAAAKDDGDVEAAPVARDDAPKKKPKADDDSGEEDSAKPAKPKTDEDDGDEASGTAAGEDAVAEEAPKKKKKKKSDDDAEAPAGSVDWKPPAEGQVNTPLPVFIPVEEGLGAESAKLRYKPFGETKWLATSMKKMPGGFGAVVPCAQVTTTGKLKLYIFLKDKDGEPVAQAGSAKAPLEVAIKNQLEGDQPTFPGEDAPKKCSSVECPPDFPGCGDAKPAAGERGNKGWGATCEKTDECQSGFACLNGSCEQSADEGGKSGDAADGESGDGEGGDGEEKESQSAGKFPLPTHLVTAGMQIDALFLGTASDVCGSVDPATGELTTFDNYACFNPDGSGEFLGKPVAGKFNQIQGGGTVADVRLLLGYDFHFAKLSESLTGLTAGVRVGLGIGGSPSVGNSADRFFTCTQSHPDTDTSSPDTYEGFCRQNAASDFMPAHFEVQAKYFPLERAMPAKSLYMPRPYVFTGFGVGQVNGGVPVDVCDTVDTSGNPIDPKTASPEDVARCGKGAVKRAGVDAYQITGLNFIPVGIGAIFPVHKNFGINVELKTMFMIPTSGTVLAPFFGPVGMF
jgi:hypothetical protein